MTIRSAFLTFILALSFSTAGAQVISTVAGIVLSGGHTGDGGPATAANIDQPFGLSTDPSGNVYFAEYWSYFRKVNTAGVISTYAGTGLLGSTGDGGPATAAQIRHHGLAFDNAGNGYIGAGVTIRKVDASGIITTIAGNGIFGYSGDGGPATAAGFAGASRLALDTVGNIFICDQTRVRKIDTAGIVTTIAGDGTNTNTGDGGPATAAKVAALMDIATDRAGNIYVLCGRVIRKIDPSGIITAFAGTGTYVHSGDGGPATAAGFYPEGICTDRAGNVYITDIHYLRKVNTAGIITSIAGIGYCMVRSGDGGPATAACLGDIWAVAADNAGNIFMSDINGHIVKKITARPPTFVNGHAQTRLLCTDVLSLDSMLAITDIDTGQSEVWSVVMPPLHGSLVATYTTLSTGSVVTPTGLSYTPAPGYMGQDSFRVSVFDGHYTDSTTIYVTMDTLVAAGIITGPDTVCPGATITLSNTVAGGVWSAANAHATVSLTGVVAGVSPGLDTIRYVVVSACGEDTATKVIYVPFSAPCESGITNTAGSEEVFNVFPNPGKGMLTVEFRSVTNGSAQVTMSNMVGAIITTCEVAANSPVHLQLKVPPGIYLVTAVTGGHRYNTKLTVQ